MAEFPALPLWTDAYLADTIHLNTREHGAYLLLLITAWRTPDCSLPDDDKLLARYARMDQRGWRSMRPVLEQFFTVSQGKWTQKRLQKERKYVADLAHKNSENVKARWLKNNKTTDTTVIPDGYQTDTPTPTPTPIIKENTLSKESVQKKAPKRRVGTILPDGWRPSEPDIAYALKRGFDETHIRDIAEDFATYWTEGKGRNGTHANWSRAWQTWIRRETPRTCGRSRGYDTTGDRPGSGGLVAALRRNLDATGNPPRPRSGADGGDS